MELDRSLMTGKILRLTLKIIYLLTGEDYVPIKRCDEDDATEPVQPETSNNQKILELTNEIIELLTGEGKHVKDYLTPEEEDGHMHASPTLQCKEEETPMSISADQSCQTNPQDGQEYEAQCKKEESAIDIHSGNFIPDSLHKSQGPMDPSQHIADPAETTDVRQNIMLNDAGGRDLRFKEEDEEVPIGPGADGARNISQLPPSPPNTQDCTEEESDDSETTEEEDEEDDRVQGLKIVVKSEEAETRMKIKKEDVSSGVSPGGRETRFMRGTSREDTATSTTGQKVHGIDCKYVTAEKPFFCGDCGGFFKHKSSLVLHRRIHSGEKPFSCSQCGKEFIQKANYLRHQRLHTGEKPYKCSECGKLYAQKQSLLMHQKFHAENEPFSCPECGENFIRQSHLVNHRKSHKGLKRYSCPDCGDFFMLRSSLVIHQRVHSAERPLTG
ncbi:uncharacterized protein [Engystomops pustulosus]|uniref:uncharacterized protein isoform X2 n=1 Tax=Engystomops pustulosus TaxID=76066 RepID=UPI003AFAABC0